MSGLRVSLILPILPATLYKRKVTPLTVPIPSVSLVSGRSIGKESVVISLRYIVATFLIMPFIISGPAELVLAQTDRMIMDPQKCVALQKQIDDVVAISESTTLSEQEKLNRLGAVVTQSLFGMLGAAKDLPDAAPILKEWNKMLTKLLATAGASSASADRELSPDAQTGVDVAKNRVKPYLDMMKLMCPGIVIPDKVFR